MYSLEVRIFFVWGDAGEEQSGEKKRVHVQQIPAGLGVFVGFSYVCFVVVFRADTFPVALKKHRKSVLTWS